MRYLDLMGGQKPHLLIKEVNNLGAETHVQYAPSTKFYLADKLAGKPWITRLPFPVHVVERVETFDRHQPQSLRHALRLSPRLFRRRRARVPRLRHGRTTGHRRVRRRSPPSGTLPDGHQHRRSLACAARAHPHLVPYRRLSRREPDLEAIRARILSRGRRQRIVERSHR